MLKLSADHTVEIFNLACEGRNLKEWVTREFAKLSSQEVLFHAQAQSTGYKIVASGCPDYFMAYYAILQSDKDSGEARDKVIEELLNQVGEAWMHTNSMLPPQPLLQYLHLLGRWCPWFQLSLLPHAGVAQGQLIAPCTGAVY